MDVTERNAQSENARCEPDYSELDRTTEAQIQFSTLTTYPEDEVERERRRR